MYSRRIIPLIVMLGIIIGIAGAVVFFGKAEQARYAAVQRVEQRPSDIRLSMTTSYVSGPIAQETLSLENRNGLSNENYRVVGRNGVVVTLRSVPHAMHDVTFLFEQAVADGIWELQDRPVHADDPARYSIDVYQLVNGEHGSHAFTFSKPHYWATTGGHQFTIHLDKNKPVPDLLTLTDRTKVEPGYERLVAAFQSYGSPQLRANIEAAKRRVRRSKK